MIPVVFTFDKRILMGAGVSVKSLINSANSETQYDIYILHQDLSEKNQKDFEELVKNTNHKINFIKVKSDKFKGLAVNKKSWTEVIYYKFLISELLNPYDKVIYSDVDVFFKQDMSELYNTDLTGYDFAAVRAEKNTPQSKNHKYFPQNKNEFIFWTGFMLMNTGKMRYEKSSEKLFDIAREFAPELRFYDLDVLNIACDNIKSLPFKYVTLETIYEYEKLEQAPEYEFLKEIYSDEELFDAKNNPAIIHYAGKLGKPWRRKKMPDYYESTVNSLPKGLKKLTFRDLRKRFFSKG